MFYEEAEASGNIPYDLPEVSAGDKVILKDIIVNVSTRESDDEQIYLVGCSLDNYTEQLIEWSLFYLVYFDDPNVGIGEEIEVETTVRQYYQDDQPYLLSPDVVFESFYLLTRWTGTSGIQSHLIDDAGRLVITIDSNPGEIQPASSEVTALLLQSEIEEERLEMSGTISENGRIEYVDADLNGILNEGDQIIITIEPTQSREYFERYEFQIIDNTNEDKIYSSASFNNWYTGILL